MSHLHCTRCGLHLAIRPETLNVENCPRCLVRHAAAAPLALAAGWCLPQPRPGRPEAGFGRRPPKKVAAARAQRRSEAQLGATGPPAREVSPPAPGRRLLDLMGPVAAPTTLAA